MEGVFDMAPPWVLAAVSAEKSYKHFIRRNRLLINSI
jgi:hypothetical protein